MYLQDLERFYFFFMPATRNSLGRWRYWLWAACQSESLAADCEGWGLSYSKKAPRMQGLWGPKQHPLRPIYFQILVPCPQPLPASGSHFTSGGGQIIQACCSSSPPYLDSSCTAFYVWNLNPYKKLSKKVFSEKKIMHKKSILIDRMLDNIDNKS